MKTSIIKSKNRYSLVLLDETRSDDELNVLACAVQNEGTSCWRLFDVRLSNHKKLSPLFGYDMNDELYAHFVPTTKNEEIYVKSKIRDYEQMANGLILWCSFNGIVKGFEHIDWHSRKPSTLYNFDAAGWFSKGEAFRRLKEIQKQWEAHPSLDVDWHIENIHKQPTQYKINYEIMTSALHEKVLKESVSKELEYT